MAMKLTEDQRLAVEDRGGALLVSAAAGSGKTRVLVERLMGYVAAGYDVDQFLVITFTNAAAAELRGRVAQALGERLARDPGNRHLRRQLTLVYQARICTIDAFCLDFLRACGHLADLDPDFRICDATEGEQLRQQALEQVLEEWYAREPQPEGFTQLVDLVCGERGDEALAQAVTDLHQRLQSHPRPLGWLEEHRGDFDLPPGGDPGDTPWGRCLLEDSRELAVHWAGQLEGLLREIAAEPVLLANYGPSLTATAAGLGNFARAAQGGWAQAAAALPIPVPAAGRKRGEVDPGLKARLTALRDQCKDQVKKLEGRFSLTADQAGEDLRALSGAMEALTDLTAHFDRAFRGAKRGRGVLEFSDAEHLTVELLTRPDGSPTPLAAEWSERFVEIMVDEYQDTNQVQNVLFQALSREGRNLFLVGDVKQSIYRFRLADPTIFLDKYARYPLVGEEEAGGPRKILLSQNFRSRPEVLEGVNYIFRGIMSRAVGELDYTDREELRPGRTDWPAGEAYRTELHVVDLEGMDDQEGAPVDKSLLEARAVVRRAAELLEQGLPVPDGAGGQRPVEPGDMVILLRSPGPVLKHYAKAFREVGIPWSAQGGEEFFDTTEVSVVLSLLNIIDNPRQDVPLLSVLRSPVYGFTPDRLAQLRGQRREGDFYAALQAGRDRGEADCAAFLEQLDGLRSRALELGSHQLIWYLYQETGIPGIFAAMEGGERRRANLMALYDCARQFESGGHRGLFEFLMYMAARMEQGERVTVPAGEGGGVRVMSIHASKGLEFPVVFLCGLARGFNESDARESILFHSQLGLGPWRLDRARRLRYTTLAREAVALRQRREMLSEEMRLLYVAMTRAECKLLLFTTVGTQRSRLDKLGPLTAYPVPPRVLADSQNMGRWVLLAALCRVEAGDLRQAAGADCPTAGAGSIPWRIALHSARDLAEERAVPRTFGDLRTAEEGEVEALAAVLAWTYPHAQSTDMPSKLTATQLKGRPRDEEVAQDAPRPASRRGGLRRPDFTPDTRPLTPAQAGTALHMAMQYIDYHKTHTEEEVRGELRRLEEGKFLTPAQAGAVEPGPILALFASPLGREMAASPHLEREFKFSLLVPAGDYFPQAEEGEEVLLQGVVDCWFENPDGTITVVDYKSDRVGKDSAAARARDYAPQLTAYSRALSRILGRRVTRRVLWFFALNQGVEIG